MLKELFPRAHRRYSSLPILGSTLEDFISFLIGAGYPQMPVRLHVRAARRIDALLQRRKCHSITDITRTDLRARAPPPGRARNDAAASAAVRLLERHSRHKISKSSCGLAETELAGERYSMWRHDCARFYGF